MSERWIWPDARAGDALANVVEAAGLAPRTVDVGAPGDDLLGWLEEAAAWLGVEGLALSSTLADLDAMLAGSAPALIRVETGVIAVLSVRRGRALVLTPEGGRERVAVQRIAALLAGPMLAPLRDSVEVELASIELRDANRTREAMVAMLARDLDVSGVLALRIAPNAALTRHARDARLLPRFVGVAIAHAASYVAGLAAWWAIGHGALTGKLDGGWLAAWALLLFTALAIRTLGTWSMGDLAIDAARLLKQRLLAGALRIELDTLRAEGIGMSLGRGFEAYTVERLAIDGGFLAMFATIELAVAAVVLGMGAGGLLHVACLAATVAVSALALRRYLAERRAWTQRRLELTHDLIEAMNGHATRLAQQPATRHHDREDAMLRSYTALGARMDGTLVAIRALVPRGWLVVSVLALAPIVVLGAASASSLALALGGVLLAHASLQRLTSGAAQLVEAAIAWRALTPVLEAAARGPMLAPPGVALAPPSPGAAAATMRGVLYRPARRAHDVLAGCDLTIEPGQHVLLEGASGAGKSTLAAVMAGLRQADAGVVLAGGLDRASVGELGWRRRVACAPQFHENHIFSGTLAFNLLLGRSWPPERKHLVEAMRICHELELAALLERMPAHLHEMVGETGWQLSHGERCRVYLARALLQGAPLVVLDESLAALDPVTIKSAIACIERRAQAALVIAHP